MPTVPMLRHIFTCLVLIAGAAAHAQSVRVTVNQVDPKAENPVTVLTPQLLQQLLIAELQVVQGDPGPGYQLLLDAARRTSDERLFARAVEVAMQAGAFDSALTALRGWKTAVAKSTLAHQTHLDVLVASNRFEELVEPFRQALALAGSKDQPAFVLSLNTLLARHRDRTAALALAQKILAPELELVGTKAKPSQAPMVAAVWTVIASQQALLIGAQNKPDKQSEADWTGVIRSLTNGFAADANSRAVADAAAQVAAFTPLADGVLLNYMGAAPEPAVQLNYARALIQGTRYSLASKTLQNLISKPGLPVNVEAPAWLLLSALQSQDSNWVGMETSAKRVLALVEPKEDVERSEEATKRAQAAAQQAYLALAQSAEKRKDFVAALSWLEKLGDSQDLATITLRRATLLAQQGKLAEARALLRNQPVRDDEDRKKLLVSEASLLRELKLNDEAYRVLLEAKDRFGADPDLSYDKAMVAEKIGKLDLMESHLRDVIAAKPADANAYNALGYALADRNLRLAEAKQLIEKALVLSPGDPYITDSLGWVEFRMGNNEIAREILQRAYDNKRDADIAAHLGEVLWVLNRQEEARSTWRQGLVLNADNETLNETLKRLGIPKP